MLNYLIKSIISGLLIALGGIAFLSSDDKIIGSILFSIGLLSIIYLKQKLYTGCLCNITDSYNIETMIVVMMGNIIGTYIGALIVLYSRLSNTLVEKAQKIVEAKSSDSFISLLLMGILCELCIFIAVLGSKHNILMIIFGVTVFVFCGFEHIVADFFYFFISKSTRISWLFPVFLGNTICGYVITYIYNKTSEE